MSMGSLQRIPGYVTVYYIYVPEPDYSGKERLEWPGRELRRSLDSNFKLNLEFSREEPEGTGLLRRDKDSIRLWSIFICSKIGHVTRNNNKNNKQSIFSIPKTKSFFRFSVEIIIILSIIHIHYTCKCHTPRTHRKIYIHVCGYTLWPVVVASVVFETCIFFHFCFVFVCLFFVPPNTVEKTK